MSSLPARFGQKLRKIRKEKGVSQERLAELAELDRTYVSSVERGLRNVTLITIGKFAEALKIKLADLMPD